MKRFALCTIALAFVAASCGGSPSSPNPTVLAKVTFTADLRTSNEVPPIANAESSGSGTATVTMDVTRDPSGNVVAGTATFVVTLSGFPAGTPINIAHIHQAVAGVNGNVVVSSGLSAGEVVLRDGSGGFTRDRLTPANGDLSIFTAIINNPAGFYFNVHTALNPGGVMRGQLVRTN